MTRLARIATREVVIEVDELAETVRPGVVDAWRIDEVRYEQDTAYQHLRIAVTAHGVTLFCDGNPQSSEIGQLAFHEAEIVPAVLLARQVQRVLVIGCSEGTVAQIAAAVGAQVDHVDLDRDCVAACAEHLPYGFTPEQVCAAETAARTGDGPIRLYYADGGAFVDDAARAGERYDVIVLDLPEEDEDVVAQHNALYEADFLARCRDLLSPGGVVSTHASRSYVSLPAADSAAAFARPWQRFGAVFGTRMYFGSDEQPWAVIMLGRADAVEAPLERMSGRLAGLAYRPRTIDELSLISATTPPRVLRDRE